jgi:hypothetical protein
MHPGCDEALLRRSEILNVPKLMIAQQNIYLAVSAENSLAVTRLDSLGLKKLVKNLVIRN